MAGVGVYDRYHSIVLFNARNTRAVQLWELDLLHNWDIHNSTYGYLCDVLGDRFPNVALPTVYSDCPIWEPDQYLGVCGYTYNIWRNRVENATLYQVAMTVFNDELRRITVPALLPNQERYVYHVGFMWWFNSSHDANEGIHDQSCLSWRGVDLLMSSVYGVMPSSFVQFLLPILRRVTFYTHGGVYDIGLLLRMIRLKPHGSVDLPETEAEFKHEVERYFPSFIDTKYVFTQLRLEVDVRDFRHVMIWHECSKTNTSSQ